MIILRSENKKVSNFAVQYEVVDQNKEQSKYLSNTIDFLPIEKIDSYIEAHKDIKVITMEKEQEIYNLEIYNDNKGVVISNIIKVVTDKKGKFMMLDETRQIEVKND